MSKKIAPSAAATVRVVYAFTNAGRPIEGRFLTIKEVDGAPLVIFEDSDDLSDPWKFSASAVFLTASERDEALARVGTMLDALTPKAAPVAPVAKAAPVAVKVTKVPAKAAPVKVTAKPKAGKRSA